MIEKLKLIPFYILLLPVSFVLHGYMEYFKFINLKDAAWLACIYCVFSATIFFISKLFFKDVRKAALMTAAWMGIYFYFGAIIDFLRQQSPVGFISRYRYLMPIIGILILLLFFYLKKSKQKFFRATLFLNTLFSIYIVIDLIITFWAWSQSGSEKPVDNVAELRNSMIGDTIDKPDIYFLLFDEYASSLSLKERFNFHNDIDSFLEASGFSVQKKSFSNYNYTPFSIASTLNMRYLDWVKPEKGVGRNDFLHCNRVIRNSSLINFLSSNGYDLVNLSVFDLGNAPSKLDQSFLPVKARMIAEGTMFPRLYKEFQPIFFTNNLLSWLIGNQYLFQHAENNNMLITDVVKESRRLHDKPRFIYTHLYLPHEPFFFDRYGNRMSNKDLIKPTVEGYLEYVLYANSRIRQMISNIINNTKGNACIILLSDHGYREFTGNGNPLWIYQNLNAVYFPGKDYRLLYDSVSNVNQFRIILNSLFRQNLPLLPDSSTYLLDDKFVQTSAAIK